VLSGEEDKSVPVSFRNVFACLLNDSKVLRKLIRVDQNTVSAVSYFLSRREFIVV
jgi:hypothetical protein